LLAGHGEYVTLDLGANMNVHAIALQGALLHNLS